jgi:hypothetical protein
MGKSANRHAPSACITIKENGLFTEYFGDRKALLETGLATSDMFPEYPKRVKSATVLDSASAQGWRIERKKGGFYMVRKWRERHAASALSPRKFQEDLAEFALRLFDTGIIARARGQPAHDGVYDQSVHQLCTRDIETLMALRNQVIAVIMNAKLGGVPMQVSPT